MDNASNILSKELEVLTKKASNLFNDLVANGAEFDFTNGRSDTPTVMERFRDLSLIGEEDSLPLIEVSESLEDGYEVLGSSIVSIVWSYI